MDTTARRRKIQKTIISQSPSDQYPHDLNLFKVPPDQTVSLNEFEDIALERLQLLRILEQASLRGNRTYSDDWKRCVKEDLAKANLKSFLRLANGINTNSELDFQARRNDHISHFILRLAYCRSDELRRWFLNRELEWFHLKFTNQTHDSIKRFLELNQLTYVPISSEEKEIVKEFLLASSWGLLTAQLDTMEFYKVAFTEVCSLVKARKVYLKQGFAYLSAKDLVVCVQSKFRALLNEALNIYYHRINSFDDDRILPLLSNLHHVYTGKNYTVREDKDSIAPEQIDQLSKTHFPLCMRHIHEIFRANHHLKHGCRLQYGLFLKAIGLLYEDANRFFREEYTKIMDSGKFEKQYLYNIKHQYGQVGNMVNYSAFSCMKIIMGNVGPGEHHGCPFRHWDQAIFKHKMTEYGMNMDSLGEIAQLVSNGHYQIACTKYFEVTHGKAPQSGINHPNQYYEESVALEKSKKD